MELGWYWLVVCGLATFRLALLFSKEDGPAWIFRKLRKLPPPKSSTREGLSCQWCVTVWAAALIVGLITLKEPAIEIALHLLAISALGIIVNQQWTRG